MEKAQVTSQSHEGQDWASEEVSSTQGLLPNSLMSRTLCCKLYSHSVTHHGMVERMTDEETAQMFSNLPPGRTTNEGRGVNASRSL